MCKSRFGAKHVWAAFHAFRHFRPAPGTIARKMSQSFGLESEGQGRDKMVESDGWELARTRGSHRQYHHPVKPGTVIIAGRPSLDLDPKTQTSILKQAGLK